jgi:hypothetical protein
MKDPLEETGTHRVPWDARVEEIFRAIFWRGLLYCIAGLGVYIPGSLALFHFIPDKAAATLAVMMFFQVLAIVGFTMIMYPTMAGGLRTGLAANRDMLGTMDKVGDVIETGNHPTVKRIENVALGVAADMKAIRIAIEERTKPLPVRRRPQNGEESPVEEVLDGPPQR